MSEIQIQARICNICEDDHNLLSECNQVDLFYKINAQSSQISQLKEENEKLKTQIKEIKQYIPKVGEPANYVSIAAYEKVKNQLESARMTISKISSSLDHVILGEGLLKFVKKHADNWLKENPRGEK